jgi:pyridinium-3,5-biscarboxylic acid mononucleotide synthase
MCIIHLKPCSFLRISQDVFDELARINFTNGTITYYSNAKIISMKANSVLDEELTSNANHRVVVVTAGTTDIPVSEEAAITLEAAGCTVDRINDCGVAGLHRIIRAIPRLTDPRVRCIIVCAGMDGALPSVVGGLVKVPVIAVPTSVGYGASFGGISAMLTMLNSCSPGVAVMNIDNGFGAAAFAYKCIQ